MHALRSSIVVLAATLAPIGVAATAAHSDVAPTTDAALVPVADRPNPCAYTTGDGHVHPTPGFVPETASDDQLAAQNFFPRPPANDTSPDGAARTAAWHQYVKWYLAGQVWKCEAGPELTPNPQPLQASANLNWSGYTAHNGTWTNAKSTERVNYLAATAGWTNQVMSHWAGVNDASGCSVGSCAHPIVQGGFIINSSSNNEVCRLFWEAYTLNNAVFYGANGQGCRIGDNVFNHAANGADHQLNWIISNDGAGGSAPSYFECHSFSNSYCNPANNVAASPDGHAHFISETETPFEAMPNFGSEYFLTPQNYSVATGWKYMAQTSNYTDWVVRYCGNAPCVPQAVRATPTGTDAYLGFSNQYIQCC